MEMWTQVYIWYAQSCNSSKARNQMDEK